MRIRTERKYRKCPEVKNKKIEIKRKEEYATNKIMENIFNKVYILLYIIIYLISCILYIYFNYMT